MAYELEDDEPQQPEEEAGSRIARPPAPSTLPPVVARGIGPTAPADRGSVEDLENLGLASHLAPRLETTLAPQPGSAEDLAARGLPPHIARPTFSPSVNSTSAIASPTGAQPPTIRGLWDRAGQIQSKPGRILGRIGVGILGALDAFGGAPLEKAAQRQKEQDLQDAETQARTELTESQKEKADAENAAAGQPKPKEEKWSEFTGFTDTDGTPLLREEASRQVVRASDGKPPAGFSPIKPAAQPKTNTPEQQLIDAEDAVDAAKTPEEKQAAQAKVSRLKTSISDYAKGSQKSIPEPGSFMALYDENGHVVGAWNPKSNRVVKPPEGALPGNTAQGAGITNKAGVAKEKEAKPYNDIVEAASEAHALADMADKGNASADVDLALSFFKMMKGSGGAGIRFTQAEQNMIVGARSAGQGLLAAAQKVIDGGQPLTPEQRKNMLAVIDMHAAAAKQHLQGGAGGSHSFSFNGQRYENVPDELYEKYKGQKGFSE